MKDKLNAIVLINLEECISFEILVNFIKKKLIIKIIIKLVYCFFFWGIYKIFYLVYFYILVKLLNK